MPKNNETTTRFRADISELKKSMQEAKRSIAVANSEFKAASSACDDWTKSTDGLSAKLNQLDSNLKNQKNILASLEKQYELTVKEMGEGSKAADDLKIKINNQKAVINNTEREISKYSAALVEVADAEKIAAKTGKSVAEVLDDVGDSAEEAEDGFTVLKGTVATFAGNILTSLASGLRDAASSLLGLADETRDYRDQMSKLNSASIDAGYGVDYAKEKYKELYGVLGDETASNTAVSNFMAIGLEQGQLNSLVNSATGIWAKYGDSIPLDGLAESVNETAKVGQVTGNLADALNWAGVSEDEFNERLAECTNEQARQKLIVAILNKEYGELGKSYKDSNASVIEAREAQADYTDTLAEMGEKIEPVTTTLKEGFNGLLQELLKLVGDVDMEAFTSKIEEGFNVLKDDVLPAVKEGLGWIIDNKDTLIAGLAGIAAGFVAFKVATLIQGVASAMQGMTIAQYALNLAMSLNPIGLVVALIAGLIAAFVTLWNNSESFRNFWIGLWEKIRSFCATAITAIVGFFTETIPTAINNMVTFLQELPSKIWTWLLNAIAMVEQWRANMIAKAIEVASGFVNNIITWIQELPSKVAAFLYDMLVTITGIMIALPILAYQKGSEFLENFISFIKQLPSMVWLWLTNTINKAIVWGGNMVDKAKEIATSFVKKTIEFIKELPSKIWTWLVNVITKIEQWRSNMIRKAIEVASGFINKVIEYVKQLPSKVWTWLVSVASKVSSWGSDLKAKGQEAAQKLLNAVIDKVKEIPDKIKSIGSDVVAGLWNGMNDKVQWLKDQIKSFVGDVTEWLKKFFKIGSPSKLMAAEVGRWLPEGIAVGIDKNAKSVINSMRDLAVNTVVATREGLGSTVAATGGANAGGVVNNFYQTINSPKQLSRLDIYRQTKNVLGYAGGGFNV